VPRVAEIREPAVPKSPGQRERYRRILRAAAALGAEHGLERMQMTDVAKDADVAIGTLYRYFPTKTVLFTALMHSQVQQLARVSAPVPEGEDAAEAVARVLVSAAQQLFERPMLTQAMLQSYIAAVAGDRESMAVTGAFVGLILRVARVEQPNERDLRLVRLAQQAWYGVLLSRLNGLVTDEEAEADILLGCQLLLAGLGTAD